MDAEAAADVLNVEEADEDELLVRGVADDLEDRDDGELVDGRLPKDGAVGDEDRGRREFAREDLRDADLERRPAAAAPHALEEALDGDGPENDQRREEVGVADGAEAVEPEERHEEPEADDEHDHRVPRRRVLRPGTRLLGVTRVPEVLHDADDDADPDDASHRAAEGDRLRGVGRRNARIACEETRHRREFTRRGGVDGERDEGRAGIGGVGVDGEREEGRAGEGWGVFRGLGTS